MSRTQTLLRWAGGAVLLLAAVAIMVRLGEWQLHRLHAKQAVNASVRDNAGAPPRPIERVLGPDAAVASTQLWQPVTVTGRWAVGDQRLVRRQPLDGTNGFWVVTPLVPASGPALLVVRGWVPASGAATASPNVPAPQPGEVTVTAYLQKPATGGLGEGLPRGQVLRMDVPALGRTLGYPVYDAYGQLRSESPKPATAPKALPLPELSEGPHRAYAIQWFLFAGLAVAYWLYLLVQALRGRHRQEPEGEAVPTLPASGAVTYRRSART